MKLIFSIFHEFKKPIESFQNLNGELFAFPEKLFYTGINICVSQAFRKRLQNRKQTQNKNRHLEAKCSYIPQKEENFYEITA